MPNSSVGVGQIHSKMDRPQSGELNKFLARLNGVRRSGKGFKALCPAHPDRNPSLSVRETNGRILVKCFAGCSTKDVCEALGIEMDDLVSEDRSAKHIAAKYPYTDEHGKLLYQKVRFDPKEFQLRRPNGRGRWSFSLGDVRRVLYRLPEVLAAQEILIVEGEKDADAGRAIGFASTTSGAAGSWREEFSDQLRGKRITIVADGDETGRRDAQKVARSLFGKAEFVKLLELPGAKDLFDWIEHGGKREALLQLIENTAGWQPPQTDGSAVLDGVNAYIRRFVSLSLSQARVAALWVVHTYAFAAAYATPYLAITSVEKQSGKTRLLEVLETLVANAWLTGRVTAAVLTRKIDAEQPTLLLDESDAAFGGDKDYGETLRGVLNTGHRNGGKSSCCVRQGSNITSRDFSTFCPKAIAGIGKLPDTVADRSIPFRLKRAVPGEGVERFRLRDVNAEAASLREQVEAWCSPIGEKLSGTRPNLPDALTDRQQDGAEPLLAIADEAGGDWPEAARLALVELCAEAQALDDSVGKQLLSDIRDIFESRAVGRLPSAELAIALAEIETSLWSEWSHGKPLTAARLARLLRGYSIVPHSIRVGDKTPKGYLREDFQDAFRRYLPAVNAGPTSSSPPQSATTQQANAKGVSGLSSNRNTEAAVAVQGCEIPNKNAACCGVAVSPAPAVTGETDGEEDL